METIGNSGNGSADHTTFCLKEGRGYLVVEMEASDGVIATDGEKGIALRLHLVFDHLEVNTLCGEALHT